MPTLPTFDVTTAQATRIQNALAPGGTQAQVTEVIRSIYKRAVIKAVLDAEAAQAEREFVAQRDAAAKAFSDEIDPPPPPPTPPPPV